MAERQLYLKNAYRVLLTRARQAMVVVVPQGEASDQTRSPEFYDPVYLYLKQLGIPELHALAVSASGIREVLRCVNRFPVLILAGNAPRGS